VVTDLAEIDGLNGSVTLPLEPNTFQLGGLGLEALTDKRICFGSR
jgi:hypothetical protein